MSAKELLSGGSGERAVAIAKNHGLSSAKRQSGESVLVGHATSQAQGIVQCFIVSGVTPITGAADGGTKSRVMNRDNATISSFGIASLQHNFESRNEELGNLH